MKQLSRWPLVSLLLLSLLLFECKSKNQQEEEVTGKQEMTQDSQANPPAEPENRPAQPEGTPTNDQLKQMADRGIDFYALGNEPFWSLRFDYDQAFNFSVFDGDTLITPPVEGTMAQDAPVTRYAATVEAGSMIVTISREDCYDDMSGEKFTHQVRVELKKGSATAFTTYNGCGRYVPDPRLAGVWTLTTLDGQPVDVAKLEKGAPQLNFDPAAMRVTGHSSCNSLNGSFIMEKDAIVFGPLASTMMACPDMEMEKTFNQLLSRRQLKYEINADNQLVLTHPGGQVLTLRRGE